MLRYLLMAVVALSATSAHAVLINVDFNASMYLAGAGTFSGSPATSVGPDTAGSIWNGVNIDVTHSSLPLLNSSGGVSGVSLTSAILADGCCGGQWTGTNYAGLMSDMSANAGFSPSDLTLSGLTPGVWSLWVYTPYALGDITANGTFGPAPAEGFDQVNAGDGSTTIAGGSDGDHPHYVFLQPTVLGDGLLSIGSTHRASGFQLFQADAVVPEPSAVVLMGLGCIGLVGITLRKKFRRA
ncbi:MAG: PEP-CTERM sorting domain-containing protein [Planctomycetes bacterium]|nr:PEP-CTERM sorting domain-containing protein [Planctomycetota bacterium]